MIKRLRVEYGYGDPWLSCYRVYSPSGKWILTRCRRRPNPTWPNV